MAREKLVCVLLLLAVATVPAPLPVDVDVQDLCTQRCPFQNKTEEGDFAVVCGSDCKIEQCSRGCMSWQKALESSCPTVCNGTQDPLPSREFYCIMGCNDALNRYFQRLKDEIGTPPAPVLVADTLTATSLRLEWEGEGAGARYGNLSYLVQYEELAGAWQYCRNQSWGPRSTVLVDKLQPYTKYRFRIALLLSPLHPEPIVSAPSVVISTLASGPPASPPAIVRATAVDSSHISVSWVPGPSPNGPILSYKLNINELPGGYLALKDIPAPAPGTASAGEQPAFYLVHSLEADKNYSISVTMRNGVGEGPPATVLVHTPPEPAVKDTQQPILILGGQHSVIRQAADMLHEPYVLYNTSHTITGVSIHVARKLLFVSDSAGFVSRSSLSRYTAPATILTPAHANFAPASVSVDWLNEHVYLLGEVRHAAASKWQVARCGLDGRALTIAMAGLLARPLHMEVDPYNGYLFWVMRDTPRPGLYRLDLADISNGVKHSVLPQVIVEDSNLGAFTVDHTNFRLLVANHSQNTVVSVSLDGREVSDFRVNTQQAMFRHVVSLATAHGLFYWTTGDEVWAEEYLHSHDSYFHNAYPDLGLAGQAFLSVAVNLGAAQPTPIPVNPPLGVQALMAASVAKISWQVPHLVGGQGKGAWQNWSYEVRLTDERRQVTVYRRGINTTTHTIRNLRADTEYVVTAAAYTSAGIGPWSSEFRGRTLRSRPHLVWASAEGLLKSDVTADHVETLIPGGGLKEGGVDVHVTAMSWYEDKVYLVTNSSHVYWYNLSSHVRGHVSAMEAVGSIAVDWLGRKLYWSNPKQQLIARGNLDGSQQEPLLLTVARELHVDSLQGFLYWSTGHAVECARLNGADRRVYYPEEVFSGKQVMGLTLDMDRRSVYWIVRSYEGSRLLRAAMAERFFLGGSSGGSSAGSPPAVTSFRLQHTNTQGPLCYFSDHLLWLQDDRNAVVADMSGQYAATISQMGLSGLRGVAVVDPALHPYPESIPSHEVRVIPQAVNPESIRITGTWNSFVIEWQPVNNVNYGQVYYEVTVDDLRKRDVKPLTTAEARVAYEEPSKLQPHTRLQVSVSAFTYWGASPQVRVTLHSPPSRPSRPTRPRVFVAYVRDPVTGTQDVTATFRWDPPAHPNGVIEDYHVTCWLRSPASHVTSCSSFKLDQARREFTASGLERDASYYFQVQASTQVGPGNASEVVRADAWQEWPVPKLLMATAGGVWLRDCDLGVERALWRGAGAALAWLGAGAGAADTALWTTRGHVGELMAAAMDGADTTKLLTLNSSALSITVDWVARYVYWSEVDDLVTSSSLYMLDLNHVDQGHVTPVRLVTRPKLIHSVSVAPFTSSLYWVEVSTTNGVGHLMTSRSDGTSVKPFFRSEGRTKREESACTCPENPAVGVAMAIDHNDPEEPRILWVDAWQGHVMVVDGSGCQCAVCVNASTAGDVGLPPTSLTSDHRLLYWANATEGRVYSTARCQEWGGSAKSATSVTSSTSVTAVDIAGVQAITALGPHLQPFPVPGCLFPDAPTGEPRLVGRTPHSVTLELPRPGRLPVCEPVTLATVRYSVYWSPARGEGTADCARLPPLCSSSVTFDPVVEVKELKPFTSYVFYIGVSNYYTDLQGEGQPPLIGGPVVFQTAAGAPSPPRNVTAHVINPTTVEVQWLPPRDFHDAVVRYEVHWCTAGLVQGVRQKGERQAGEQGAAAGGGADGRPCKATIPTLLVGHSYHVWVRGCSPSSGQCTDSDPVEVRTFPEPEDIVLVGATSSSVDVAWSPGAGVPVTRFDIQCTETSSGTLIGIVSSGSPPAPAQVYTLSRLRPKTLYTLRLALVYGAAPEPYVWPPDERFTYETRGDRPSAPGIPVVQRLRWDVYQVTWEAAADNGAALQQYSLQVHAGGGNETSPGDDDWLTCYNGTDNYWIISELAPSLRYAFRVRSRNQYGWGPYSPVTDALDITEADTLVGAGFGGGHQELVLVLGITVPLLVLAVCVTGALSLLCVYQRRSHEKKTLQGHPLSPQSPLSPPRGPDLELAILRELPRRANFVQHTNALYSRPGVPGDGGGGGVGGGVLPRIARDRIVLTKFLGSGAFGEVFEGRARAVAGGGGEAGADAELRVAIKTLRKGATDHEKAEFLKEAQLMSNFKHEHILSLLGVCLDNDPHFIIMELMEGGDLLSFLRTSRTLLGCPDALTLADLLAMCVHVARGCSYLEEMHFVHRDLACRNCLVSSADPRTRVVKIGDFGLARDIYKNDYYRKEGEGLLPVRWMAPESLVDGVFTCQSDVWAFGVLVWEVMTLGQQPYPARTNVEVLHYVRGGGRLGRPGDCPRDLHQLMLHTWSYHPDSRPTFKDCLRALEDILGKSSAVPLRPPAGGMDNRGFFHEDNHNSSGSSWKTSSDGGSRDHIPFLHAAVDVALPGSSPGESSVPGTASARASNPDPPKYLELIYDSDTATTVSDGYEVPRTLATSTVSEDGDGGGGGDGDGTYTNVAKEAG